MRTLLIALTALASLSTFSNTAQAEDLPDVVANACRAQCDAAPPTPEAIPGEHHVVELAVPSGTQNITLDGNTLTVTIFTNNSNVIQTAEFELIDSHGLDASNIAGMESCSHSTLRDFVVKIDAEELSERDAADIWEEIETPTTFHAFSRFDCPRVATVSTGPPADRPRLSRSSFDADTQEGLVCDNCEAWWASQGLETPEAEQLTDTYAIEIVSSSTVASN